MPKPAEQLSLNLDAPEQPAPRLDDFANKLKKYREHAVYDQTAAILQANNCFTNNCQLIHMKNSPTGPRIDVEELANSLQALRDNKISNASVLSAAFDWLGLTHSDPLYKAGIALSIQADGEQQNAYHNNDHLRDVTVLTLNMLAIKVMQEHKVEFQGQQPGHSLKHVIGPDEIKLLAATLIAAVSHDLQHDGVGNTRLQADQTKKYEPFFLEAKAAGAAANQLNKAGVPEEIVAAVQAMIYTTDVAEGYKVLRSPNYARTLKIDGPIIEQMKNPAITEMTNIIMDADLLGSAGMTATFVDQQTERLSKEINFKIDAKGTAGFLEKLVGNFYSEPGKVFEKQLQHLMELNQKRLSEPGLAGKSLEETEQAISPSPRKMKF